MLMWYKKNSPLVREAYQAPGYTPGIFYALARPYCGAGTIIPTDWEEQPWRPQLQTKRRPRS